MQKHETIYLWIPKVQNFCHEWTRLMAWTRFIVFAMKRYKILDAVQMFPYTADVLYGILF